jgi:hypothetical protein
MLPSISVEVGKDQKTKQSGNNTARCHTCLQEAKSNSEWGLWKLVHKCHLHGEFLLPFVLLVSLRTHVINLNFINRITIIELLSTTDRVFRVGNISNFLFLKHLNTSRERSPTTKHKLLLPWRHVCVVESGKLQYHTSVLFMPFLYTVRNAYERDSISVWTGDRGFFRGSRTKRTRSSRKKKNNGQDGEENVIYVFFFASQVFCLTKSEDGRISAHVIMILFYTDAISVSLFHSEPPTLEPAKKFATFY